MPQTSPIRSVKFGEKKNMKITLPERPSCGVGSGARVVGVRVGVRVVGDIWGRIV